jgi:plastocyanin
MLDVPLRRQRTSTASVPILWKGGFAMRGTIVVCSLVTILALSACRDTSSLEPAPGTVLVDIHDAGFSPETVHVAIGRSVRWTNRSTQPHAISSPDFNSGNLFPGWWFEANFEAAGTYDYVCPLHTTKEGTIVIE